MSHAHLQKRPCHGCCHSCEDKEFNGIIPQDGVATVPHLVKCTPRPQCGQEVFAQYYYDGSDQSRNSGYFNEDEITLQQGTSLKNDRDSCVYGWERPPTSSMQRHRMSSQMYADVLRTEDIVMPQRDVKIPRKNFNMAKMRCYGGHDICDDVIQRRYKLPGPCNDGSSGNLGYPYYSRAHPYMGTEDHYLPAPQTNNCNCPINHLRAVCDGTQSSDGMVYVGKNDGSPMSGSDASVNRMCEGTVQNINSHVPRAKGHYYPSKGLSCAVLLNQSPNTKSTKSPSKNTIIPSEEAASCCNTSTCDAMNSSRSDQDSPHLKLQLDSPLVLIQKAVDNPRPIVRGRQPSFPAGKKQQMAFFSDTVQVAKVYSIDRSSRYTFQIYPKVDRGFFMADNGWTCYRRNYFQVSAAFNAKDQNDSVIQLPCLVEGLSKERCLYGLEFQLGISARVSKSDDKKHVVLVQHTPKRDRGPQMEPRLRTVCAGGDLGQYSSVNPGQLIVTFERLQFKTATANNGRRRAAQQYYALVVELLATVKGSQTPKLIAYVESAPLVVRGRSPGHYSDSVSASTNLSNLDGSSSTKN